jgi:endonuclease YncB( thermonuclease family)
MRFAPIVSILVMSLALNAQTIQGKVVRVSDGDTITILDATNAQNKVRLNKIDAPEKKQAFGEVSRKHLASMVAGKIVNVEWAKKDKYGRILGDITIGTTNVNLRMVQDGLA